MNGYSKCMYLEFIHRKSQSHDSFNTLNLYHLTHHTHATRNGYSQNKVYDKHLIIKIHDCHGLYQHVTHKIGKTELPYGACPKTINVTQSAKRGLITFPNGQI